MMEQPLTVATAAPAASVSSSAGESLPAVPAAVHADCAVLVFDETGRVVSSNPAAQRLLGISGEELLSRRCLGIAAGEHDQAADMLAASVGSPLGIVSLTDDESEAIIVKGTQVSLDAAIVGRPLTLLILDQQFAAQSGMATLASESLASVSHEARTPLCTITGYLDLLLEQYRTIRRADLLRMLRVLRRSARWLEHSVDNMIAGLNIFAGRFELAPCAVRLTELVEEAVGMVEVLAAGKEQSLVLAIPEGKAAVWADRQRVLQVLANLLSHAIRQAPRRGRVTLATKQAAGEWQISVSDNSPGTPWWQQGYCESDHSAPSDHALGSSQRLLGVAVARYVIEMHGGSMGLSSSPENGNTFWFTLPSAPAGITDGPAFSPHDAAMM